MLAPRLLYTASPRGVGIPTPTGKLPVPRLFFSRRDHFPIIGAEWRRRQVRIVVETRHRIVRPAVADRVRQSRIIVGKSLRYCSARPALDSPWYQITPLMPYGTSGCTMAL